jgi:Ca2+-binding EF-hand superfamily protein
MSAQDRYFSQKIRTLFTRFDMDKNGAIEIDDFHVWSDRLTKIGKLNSEKESNLRENLLYLWEVFFEPADLNADGSVEIPELVIHMKNVNMLKIILIQYNINKINLFFNLDFV